MAQDGAKTGQDGPVKRISRWPQKGPKMPPRGAKMFQDGPKRAREVFKMAPRWPNAMKKMTQHRAGYAKGGEENTTLETLRNAQANDRFSMVEGRWGGPE